MKFHIKRRADNIIKSPAFRINYAYCKSINVYILKRDKQTSSVSLLQTFSYRDLRLVLHVNTPSTAGRRHDGMHRLGSKGEAKLRGGGPANSGFPGKCPPNGVSVYSLSNLLLRYRTDDHTGEE